ncbi:hypothetical protein [Halostella litorea]|uniref:hypothetical protein n=1 Tax=Halostella litorea TaxID=2528831 RepID=UPI0010924864|nr:hypothetical protein [Halostella litorea]
MGATTRDGVVHERFTVHLVRDCGINPDAIGDDRPETVTVRQSSHPDAAARVEVDAHTTTWVFELTHDGTLDPQRRRHDHGSPSRITAIPGWLQRVLLEAGYDDVDA